MALNLDTTFKLKAKVEGARSVDNFKKQLRGLDTSSKLSKVQLGKMNIEINRMARAAGNTTKGLREHIRALTLLRDRTDIGGKAYKRLGNQIDRLKSKLKGLDGQAASTGQRLASLLATVGVGRAIRGVVGTASRYEEEVTKTAAIEGGNNFAQIDEGIRATAQIAAGTPQEVAELATELARMGRSADEITGSLNGIVLGAEATSTSFADMGRIVGTTMEVFGIDVSKTERAVDILAAGALNSAQDINILGESLKMAAPTAATLGVTLNDTVATLGLLANAGIRGSEAGTGLRTGLQRLVIAGTGAEGKLLGITRGSKMLTEAMNELGAEVLDANGELKPLDQVLKSLRDNMAGRSQGEQMEIAKALFGTEQGTKFLALIQNVDSEIDNMFTTVRNSAEVTQRTREAMASFGLTTKILGGNVQVVTNQIGSAFIAVLNPLAQILNNLLTAASKLPTPVKGIASAFAAAGLAATGLATSIAAVKAIAGVGFIQTMITSLKGLALGFLGAAKAAVVFLATNPFGWAVIGVTVITGLLIHFKGLRQGLVKVLQTFNAFRVRIVKGIFSIGKGFVEMVNKFIINTLKKLSKLPFIGKIFGFALEKYQNLGEIVVKISDKTGQVIDDAKVIIGDAIEVIDDAKEIIGDAIEVTKDAVTNVGGQVVNTVTNFDPSDILGDFDPSNILGAGGGSDTGGIDKDTEEKQNQVLQGMKAALDDYQAKAEDVAGAVKSAMTNALQGMEDALVDFVMTGKLAFNDLARSIIADITRIAIRSAIISPLTNWFEGIFKLNADGNAYKNGEVQKFAYGGSIVNRPTMFPMKNGMGLMGEAGAEAIMPLKRGSDGKLGVTAQGGGGNVVNVSVDASGSSAQGNNLKATALGKMIGSAIEAELVKQKRPGGLLYT